MHNKQQALVSWETSEGNRNESLQPTFPDEESYDFYPKKHIAIENREERTDFYNIPKSKEIPT